MMHILSFKIVSLGLILIYGLDFSHLADFPTIHYMTEKGYWIAYLLMGINIPLIAQITYNKICVTFRGRSNQDV